MNTLLRATLAGEGPDVAIQVANTNGIAGAVLNTGNDTPVNYGLRNAVLDLTQFEDFPEIAKRFNESAIIPFSFDGATYALPDTQTWLMMFYRKDLVAKWGLTVPKTWAQFRKFGEALKEKGVATPILPHWFGEYFGISWGFVFEVMNRGGEVADAATHEPKLTLDGPAGKTLEAWKKLWIELKTALAAQALKSSPC